MRVHSYAHVSGLIFVRSNQHCPALYTNLRNLSSSGRMTGKPSCQRVQDAKYGGEFFSILSTEYVRKDLVTRSGRT